MSVTLKGQSAIYEGTSADMKPSDAAKNAIFQELDTGIDYYYNGTDWNEIPKSGGGGGTGTDDYTELNNKPKVNNVTVVGDLTSSDLKLQGEITSSHKLSADLVDDTNTTNKFNVQADWNQATNSAPDYIKNKPPLGTAASKNATDTYNATGTDVTTGKAVAAALATLPEPMVFKGSLGTGGTITSLPTASSSNKGYVYKVITAGTYASQSAKVGDTFISDGSAWVLIPSGDEPSGTVTNVAVANGGGLTVSGSPVTSSGTITVGHSNFVTAKTSSSVKKFTYDEYGHVTGSSELSTVESNALASGIDSTKVEQIETNKNNISTDEAALVELVDGGAKNIADFTLTTKTTYTTATSNGVTITRNGDIFTVSGTSNTDKNIFFNIYYDGSTSTKMIPPGDWVGLIEDYTGSVVKDLAVQICTPIASSKEYGAPIQFSLSGSESGNWIRINLRPSTTYDGSFRLMICSKAAWDISHAYQPYRPSYQELYEMVKALQANQ